MRNCFLALLVLLVFPRFAEASQIKKCAAGPYDLPARMADVTSASVRVGTMAGTGSGTVVSPDGFIITAAHVVGGADEVTIAFSDGSEGKASVVRLDEQSDSALLRTASPTPHCVSLASSRVAPGAEVYAIGSPVGSLTNTVTKGVVSGYRDRDGLSIMQTDASVSPGNSGGGIFDSNGYLHAVVGSKLVGEGVENIAFAVTVEAALTALGIKMGPATDSSIDVVRRTRPAPEVPAPIIQNRPTKTKTPPTKAACRGMEVTEDKFAGVTHVRGRVAGVNVLYDGGAAAQLKVYWNTPGLTVPEDGKVEVTFDITLDDGTAIRLFAKTLGVVPTNGAVPTLESHYDLPVEVVQMMAISPITAMAFRVGDSNVYPQEIAGYTGKFYKDMFSCVYVHVAGSGG